jgi:hypothetical protein
MVAAGNPVRAADPRSGSRRCGFTVVAGFAGLAALAVDAGGTVHAQGRLDARYSATLAGVPFGKGGWQIDIRDDQFSATANGATSGVLRFLATGQGQSVARGSVAAGQPVAGTYASNIATDKKYDDVRMVISRGEVKDLAAEPPSFPDPNRIPLTDAHRRGVTDPMTAALMRVPGNGDVFTPEACPRSVSVFDGRMRYDLRMAFKRLDKVRSDKGYQGTVVVCGVRFLPVAGFVPERPVIRYVMALTDIEAWLAPIAGTRVMVPYRMQSPTPIGTVVVQATDFVSIPQPARASASGVNGLGRP